MFQSIPNQPLVFHSKDTDTPACIADDQYCQLVQQRDLMCFQHRQTSCLPQILCDPDFTGEGAEILTNGDFTYADYGGDAQGWEWDGDDWEWDAVGQRLCINTAGGYGPATYTLPEPGDCFALRFEFEISGTTTGTLQITLPSGNTIDVTADGEYSYIVAPGASIILQGQDSWDGCIDNMSLKCVTECWSISLESESATTGGISFANPGICKPDGLEMTFSEVTPSLTVGEYYQVWVEVANMVSGQIEFFLGGLSIGVITEAGTFGLYGVATGTTFSFTMSGDFSGCLTSVNVYQLSQAWTLKILTGNGNELADISSMLVYGITDEDGNITKGDLISLCIPVTPEFTGLFADFQDDKRDCWSLLLESPDDGEVMIYDPGTEPPQLVRLGEFEYALGEVLADRATVTDVSNLNASIIAGQLVYEGGEGYIAFELDDPFVQGNEYYVSFDILCLTGTNTFDSFYMSLGATASTGGEGVFNADNYPTAIGHYVYKITAGTDGDFLYLYFNGDISKMCLDNISVRVTPCPKESWEGACMRYTATEWEGTKLFTACNEDEYSFGFDWSDGFRLRARLGAHILGPRYATEVDDTHLGSDGRRTRIFADTSKKMDLIIHAVDELTHDYIRTMLKCDVLYIETDYQLRNRYICLDNEYVPEGDRKGQLQLTEARVEIQKYDNTIFNSNCG